MTVEGHKLTITVDLSKEFVPSAYGKTILNLHIVREIFAAWNAHDVEGLVKRLDTKTTWKSDAFPAPFSGHEGDSAVLQALRHGVSL